ncbi:cation:proton antiporter [Magnetococcus sp. PR-3]|uniref:cation:proton antiporter n=1 Tax=Magnetococcus sp. PR-3 TaxID=3120355 RepID=UPI002FCE379B
MGQVTAQAHLFVTLGGLFLLGLATEVIGRHIKLPRVTLLLLMGVALGPMGLTLIVPKQDVWLLAAADAALLMVGFLLGSKFTPATLDRYGRQVMGFSIAEVVITVMVVGVGLHLLGVPTEIALLLSGIATATAPAATIDVVRESKAEGPFSDTLLGIVAVDDALGLMVFSLLVSVVAAMGGDGGFIQPLLISVWEIAGGLLLGGFAGVALGQGMERCDTHEGSLVITFGGIALAGGIAFSLGVSFLLTAMSMGAVLVNVGKRSADAVRHVEKLIWPFMILLFVFGGASMQLEGLAVIGWVGAAYISLRILSRFLGGWVGGWWTDANPVMTRWMGMALMPQAGVALGMALIASQRFPHLEALLMPVVIGSTVIFELIGPLMTRRALEKAGEVGRGEERDSKELPKRKRRTAQASQGSTTKRKLGDQRK